MTLRARIAAVAGLAVAAAILATAVFTYLAVRSSLRGEIDRSLERRAEGLREIRRGPDGPPGRPLGPPPAERLRPGPGRTPFGGAEGYAQFVSPTGAVRRPPGAPVELPVDGRTREIADAGDGRRLRDMDVDGTTFACSPRASLGVAPSRSRGRLTRSTTSSTTCWWR